MLVKGCFYTFFHHRVATVFGHVHFIAVVDTAGTVFFKLYVICVTVTVNVFIFNI